MGGDILEIFGGAGGYVVATKSRPGIVVQCFLANSLLRVGFNGLGLAALPGTPRGLAKALIGLKAPCPGPGPALLVVQARPCLAFSLRYFEKT
ncbi:hypothetical protein AMTR_s00041p00121680 [Amborella trichopoda]|uniref:Uncharacterized protein n=1 Tax=Amborella trichopoda TaxID=13333 RepID=W1PYG7_AMBTC|nr:hypothetical protein AMTR_s00041p00121680 [Amborella trichopoda]